MACQISSQSVQPKAGKVHVVGPAAMVQHREDIAEPLNMFGSYPPRRSAIVKGLEPPMLERSNHRVFLWCRLSLVN